MKQLPPPDDAVDNSDAVEVLRGWVVGGDLQVSLAFEAFGDAPELWGQLLAEVAAHVADAMSAHGFGDRSAIFTRLQGSLLDHLASPCSGLTGTVHGPTQ